MLATQMKMLGITYRSEVKFAAEHVGLGPGIRKRLSEAGLKNWRADFVIGKLLVECDGGLYLSGGGRHQRGTGYEDDLDKYHHAMRIGYTVYRCGSKLIKSGEAVQFITEYIARSRSEQDF